MFALRSGRDNSTDAARPAASAFAVFTDGFVLPRLLRRPARLLARLADGDITPPRFAASIGTAVFLSASALYGAYLGGHMPTIVQAITARSGFAVDEVKITGHTETSEIDILDRLGLDGWTSLVGFDADAARTRIAELPWVEGASVRKVYPDMLEVHVEERKPFAIWQHGRELSIVGETGNTIAPYSGGRHSVLPLIIGVGAPQHAAVFINKIKSYPELSARVKGYIRVAERRWDLRLENGLTVKLPEAGEDQAIASLLTMDREKGLLSRDILAVDMRLSDRLVIQLTPDTVERREAAFSDQVKASKKAEKKI